MVNRSIFWSNFSLFFLVRDPDPCKVSHMNYFYQGWLITHSSVSQFSSQKTKQSKRLVRSNNSVTDSAKTWNETLKKSHRKPTSFPHPQAVEERPRNVVASKRITCGPQVPHLTDLFSVCRSFYSNHDQLPREYELSLHSLAVTEWSLKTASTTKPHWSIF